VRTVIPALVVYLLLCRTVLATPAAPAATRWEPPGTEAAAPFAFADFSWVPGKDENRLSLALLI
jgi:hypothetical protein